MVATARAGAIGLCLTLAAAPAMAQPAGGQDPAAGPQALTFGTQGGTGGAVFFTAMLGARVGPAYFGSDEMAFGPSFRAGIGYLDLGGIRYGRERFDGDPLARGNGFAYGLSFRFIGPRDSDHHDELDGLDDIDPTLEIGGVVGYALPGFEALVDTRYGLGGSDGWVSEVKLNYVARPAERVTLRIGPRLLFGSENYTGTYFGVTEAESARSGLPAYDPDGGLVSAGLEAVATYRLSERWWLEGAAKWERYVDSAADSPIVEQGSDDFTQVRIGLRRSFSLRF